MNFNKIERAMGQIGFGDTKPAKAEPSPKAKSSAHARAVSKARQSRRSLRGPTASGDSTAKVAPFESGTLMLGDTDSLTETSSDSFSDSIPELTREEVRALVKRETRRRKQLKQAVDAQGSAINDPAASDGQPAPRSEPSLHGVRMRQPVERRVRSEPRVAKLERRVSHSSSLVDAVTEAFDTVVHSLDMPNTEGKIEPPVVSSANAESETSRLREPSRTKAVKMRKDRSRTGGRVKLNLDQLFAHGYSGSGNRPDPNGKDGAAGKLLPLLEEFRRIKRPLLANAFGQGLPAALNGERIMITSALPSEGKSFCAIHLALSIASEVDTSVLLVEADVAKPTVLTKLKLRKAKGLSNWFADPRIDVRDLTLSTDIPGLKILPAGMEAPDSIDMLASRAMTTFFDRLREAYPHDLIIVDAPPLLPATETKVLATNMGQVVVVVEAGETPKTVVADALEMLKDIEIVGLVLNKSLRQPKSAGYGYGYGY